MDETKLENGLVANEGISADKAAGTSVFINSKKENIFKPIQAVSGVVQRKQPLPVLSNILFIQNGKQVKIICLFFGKSVSKILKSRCWVPPRLHKNWTSSIRRASRFLYLLSNFWIFSSE